MAFRGNPNAGAADPQFLNFLFNRQDAKMKQERQLALDRLQAGAQYEEERRKNEVHKQKMAQDQFKLLSDIKGASKETSDALQAISGRFTSGDLTQPQGASLPTDQSFESIVQQNDPRGVAQVPQNDQALSALNNDASQLARLRGQVTGQDQQSALSDVFGQATIAGRTEERDRNIKRDTEIETEERQIRQIVAKSIAGVRGDLAQGNVLLSHESNLRDKIRIGKIQGLDTSIEEERLKFAKALRQGITKKGQISVTSPPSPVLVRQVQQSFSSSDLAARRLRSIQKDWQDGTINLGVKGSFQFGVEFAQEWLSDLASSAEIVGPGADQLASLVEKAQTQSGPISFDSNGEQLTLDLDSMILAWQFVRSNKDTARITLLEFTTALKQLGLTGITKTEAGVLSAMRKVTEMTVRKRMEDRAFLQADFSEPLDKILDFEISDDDKELINGWNKNKRKARSRNRPDAIETPDTTNFDNLPESPTDEQLRNAMRNAAKARLKAGGN